jgi:hypothetical protein
MTSWFTKTGRLFFDSLRRPFRTGHQLDQKPQKGMAGEKRHFAQDREDGKAANTLESCCS